MFGVLSVICFVIAYFIHGGAASVSNAWIDWQGLSILGLLFLALHLLPVLPLSNFRR